MSTALTHLEGKAIGVFGLARSGLATIKAATAGGAGQVFAWDDGDAARQAAGHLGATIEEAADWPWQDLSSLVLAPGVPFTHPTPHPVVGLARAANVEVICDIELLFREVASQARFVAITGTNGKSTTTALVGHILRFCGMNAHVGGNIGVPVLDMDWSGANPVFVLEMSSFQLDLIGDFRPDIAVWLNLTADHLDRHGDLAGYRAAKERIFLNMAGGDLAIIGVDDAESLAVAAKVAGRADAPKVRRVSVTDHRDSEYFVDESGTLHAGETARAFGQCPTLRGRHNWQNAACAAAVAKDLGLSDDAVDKALQTYPGLEHRMEILGRRGKVLFVNDSKATNPEAAGRALSAFMPVYWIAGGQSGDGGVSGLHEQFGRIAKAYLIGDAAAGFSAELAGAVPHVIAGDLGTAFAMAADDAAKDGRSEPVVLLSPACKSFDQFPDFAARGEAFRAEFLSTDRSGPAEENGT